jgi:hypothetical protein
MKDSIQVEYTILKEKVKNILNCYEFKKVIKKVYKRMIKDNLYFKEIRIKIKDKRKQNIAKELNYLKILVVKEYTMSFCNNKNNWFVIIN